MSNSNTKCLLMLCYISVDGDEKKNIHALKICDFAATTDSDGEVYIYLTKDEQTKNHQDDPNSAQGRMYTRKDDPLCPVKSFMMYKRHLNPKCSNFFQRLSKGESPVNWYTNAPVVTMLSGIWCLPSAKVQDSQSDTRTTHSGSSVHILDSNQFAGRHITSITGHKSETSL